MDKTIKINLAGVVFQIEEDAYHLLRDYLAAVENRLKSTQGGNEALDDIESRIAEIFQSQKGLSGVISTANVDAMISIIGQPEDFDQGSGIGSETPRGGSFRRHLYRNPDDAIISGVGSGIAAYLNTNPVWIRLLFILFTITGGVGFFVYIALWIALPPANTESRKRELYGENYRSGSKSAMKHGSAIVNNAINNTGNALNETFRAVGKLLFVIMRIILIVIGIVLVVTGFMFLVTFVMTFFFRYPWFFIDQSVGTGIFYIPDLLNFLMRPELTPWVIVLISLVVILPLLAIIYWGIKMVFWLKVKDRVVSAVALVTWVMSISALSLIMFNQGISFAEDGHKTDQVFLENKYDTLYLAVDKKISSLVFDQEITIPDNAYSLYIDKTNNKLYGRPELTIHSASDLASLKISRHSFGKSRREATEKAESLKYDYRISGDTVYISQYYQIPSDHRWSGTLVEVDLFIPNQTVIWIDEETEIMFEDNVGRGTYSWELGNNFWRWTENGPEKSSVTYKK